MTLCYILIKVLGFYINLPIGALVAIVIVLIRIPEQKQKSRALSVFPKLHQYLDLIGFCLFAPAVLQLLLALQYGGNQFAWRSSQVIGLFCGSAATFVVWIFWNRHKGDDALLPHSMLSRRMIWVSGLFQGLFMSSLYGSIYYLPIYFQAINGVSAMLSGVYLLPTILPQLFTVALSGPLSESSHSHIHVRMYSTIFADRIFAVMKLGYVIPIALVSTILLSISGGLYSMLQPDSPIGWWVGFQIMAGIGSGLGLNLVC